ncbi:Bestrophin-1 [Taenia solium]|eukprot:TsM_000413700 transcript=TsM_000413700 gene=TsM_000413700
MDKVCVPLVYTQVNCYSLVVTLAVYSYFLSSVIGRQFIVNTSDYSEPLRRDYYVPLYTIIEFIVAETLVNPMGEDDEDFDINDIINFNWSVQCKSEVQSAASNSHYHRECLLRSKDLTINYRSYPGTPVHQNPVLSKFFFVSVPAREQYGMRMVDRKYHPTELVRDKFWNSANVSLPHTADSRKLQSTQMVGSVFNIEYQPSWSQLQCGQCGESSHGEAD